MNPKILFALLTEGSWITPGGNKNAPPKELAELDDANFEYLLRFCEVNRADFCGRLKKEKTSLPLEVLMYRILLALRYKWSQSRDYRYLNILNKFVAMKYIGHLPKDPEGLALMDQIKHILKHELNYGR